MRFEIILQGPTNQIPAETLNTYPSFFLSSLLGSHHQAVYTTSHLSRVTPAAFSFTANILPGPHRNTLLGGLLQSIGKPCSESPSFSCISCHPVTQEVCQLLKWHTISPIWRKLKPGEDNIPSTSHFTTLLKADLARKLLRFDDATCLAEFGATNQQCIFDLETIQVPSVEFRRAVRTIKGSPQHCINGTFTLQAPEHIQRLILMVGILGKTSYGFGCVNPL